MGLDSVEFVMAVEDSFGIVIPNEDAAGLLSPRLLIDYLMRCLPTDDHGSCLSQRAFYQVRRALARRLGVSPRSVLPSTVFAEVIPKDCHKSVWMGLKEDLHAEQWVHFPLPGWLGRLFSENPSTVGELANFMQTRNPKAVLGPDRQLSRSQVEDVVIGLIEAQLGVSRSQYNEDLRFVEDMGVN